MNETSQRLRNWTLPAGGGALIEGEIGWFVSRLKIGGLEPSSWSAWKGKLPTLMCMASVPGSSVYVACERGSLSAARSQTNARKDQTCDYTQSSGPDRVMYLLAPASINGSAADRKLEVSCMACWDITINGSCSAARTLHVSVIRQIRPVFKSANTSIAAAPFVEIVVASGSNASKVRHVRKAPTLLRVSADDRP